MKNDNENTSVATVTVDIFRDGDQFRFDIGSSRHPSITPESLGIAMHDAANIMLCEALGIGTAPKDAPKGPITREEAVAKATVIVDDMFKKAFG